MCYVVDEYENRTRDAGNRATAAGQQALDAQEKVGMILNKLPEDKQKTERLLNAMTKTGKSISDAVSQGMNIESLTTVMWTEKSGTFYTKKSRSN